MSVSTIQPFSQYNSSYVPSNQQQSQTFDQLHAEKNAALISITTDEGDIVTLSQNSEFSKNISMQRWDSPLARGMNFTAESLQSEAFSFSVQGDLNEEELADLANLYTDLTKISEDFYSGNLEGAMNGAMSIGDMGSLANLSATFSRSEMTSTRMTSNHIIPASKQPLADGFKDLPPLSDQDTSQRADHASQLQAQWQQIMEYLDNRSEVDPQGKAASQTPANSEATGAQHMMARMQETMISHPRLSPFALPLAHKSLDQGGENLRPTDRMIQHESMKIDLLAELENWLMA